MWIGTGLTRGNMYLTEEEILQRGLCVNDQGQEIPLNPLVIEYALLFRVIARRYPEVGVIYDATDEYMWVHDASHGFLGAPPTEEGERHTALISHVLGVKTQQDFVDLVACYRPTDFVAPIHYTVRQ